MNTVSIVEIVIAAILFLIMILSMFNKRVRKLRVAILVILLDICLLTHVGVTYITEEPVLALKGNSVIALEANETYIDPGIQASYHKKDVQKDVKIQGKVDTKKPGEYKITYEYYYQKDKVKQLERIVKVEDHVAPKITLKGQEKLTIYEDEEYKELGYTVEDNVDQDLEQQVKVQKNEVSKNEYELIYTVKDSSGNEAKAVRNIILKKRQTSQNTQTNSDQTKEEKNESSTKKPTSNSGIIYLTFDDGPSLDITPKILDILKQENVKATFFLLNYGESKEKLVKRIVEEGHTVAIHGYSHNYKKIYASEQAYMQNLTKLQTKIKNTTGVTTTITRFPGGSSNTISSFNPKIMTKLTRKVVEEGFRYYDWTVDSNDAGGAKTRDEVYNNVTKGLIRNAKNTVLMHDFSGNQKTLDALKAIIQYGKQNGYTFQKITTDTPMVKHKINN